MKKFIFTFIFLSFLVIEGFSQSAEKVSEILFSEKVTLGQISYLAGTCGLDFQEETDYTTAFEQIKQLNLLPKDSAVNDFAKMDQVAYLFMKSTKMSGGLFYKLLGTKRYAFKEIKAKGIIPQNIDPGAEINGHDAFAILNGCLSETEK